MVQKILIVDDELDKKRKLYNLLYEASLSKNWYKLIFSTTGEEALEIIKKDKKQEISLIILDLRLDKGEINGVDFANTLAASHIDKKIIVWTAYKEWSNSFSDLAKNNIIKVIQRTDYSLLYLKDLCDAFIMGQQLEAPGKQGASANSKMLGYHSIRRMVKSLPERQRYNLFVEILPIFKPETLLKIKNDLPQSIDDILDDSMQRSLLKQWIEEQQNVYGLLKEVPPIRELNDVRLEIREKPMDGKIYIDYFIRWSLDGKHHSKYIKKSLVEKLPAELRNPSQFPNSPDSLAVIFKKTGRSRKKNNDS
ncbi:MULTISPECIES: response regulator [Crocosphaera]|uniref:Response regulatory domain-containing protein n=2 Tax=Crocosphaera watsonii TaxID=263511 RepID=G5J596_CROWT|nr:MULTISPECIES: response regulator [Crocosphaera]EHJ12645.1 hypothetical protein CWATWH0003_2661 [Crocosphaera watsonii WH 0003]NQZ64685.1 response regulator [Crocosphaera sp.]CCQ54176.1 hypothetical protein CWATWH0005_5664 [Crocosphaera watsonii WH 0005]